LDVEVDGVAGEVALHALAEPGKFTTDPAHLHSRKQIFDLAAGNYLRQRKDILFLGPPGVGKTHLAQALGYESIKQGKEVLYRSIFDLVRDFLKDEAFRQQDKTLAGI
jgi:DNA replication protein DnaC